MAISNEESSKVVATLISMLEKNGIQPSTNKLEQIQTAVDQANEGNAGQAKALLSKAFGTTWENANTVAWPLLADLVKRSLGL